MPVRVQALPEGTCIHAHVPIFQVKSGVQVGASWFGSEAPLRARTHCLSARMHRLHGHAAVSSARLAANLLTPLVVVLQITAEGPYAPLCTYLETLLTQVSAAGGLFRAAGQHGLTRMALLWLV